MHFASLKEHVCFKVTLDMYFVGFYIVLLFPWKAIFINFSYIRTKT